VQPVCLLCLLFCRFVVSVVLSFCRFVVSVVVFVPAAKAKGANGAGRLNWWKTRRATWTPRRISP